MAYRYRNVKTHEVITTTDKVSGRNWEPVEEEAPIDDIPDEELVEEEAPAGKPKTSRRGKKQWLPLQRSMT